MKRFYILELDVDCSFARVLEVTREFTANSDASKAIAYYRGATDDAVVYGTPGPKFYGKLDALLVTADKIAAAAPIVPEPPTPEMPDHVRDFLAAPATEGSGGPMAETVERVEEASRG